MVGEAEAEGRGWLSEGETRRLSIVWGRGRSGLAEYSTELPAGSSRTFSKLDDRFDSDAKPAWSGLFTS